MCSSCQGGSGDLVNLANLAIFVNLVILVFCKPGDSEEKLRKFFHEGGQQGLLLGVELDFGSYFPLLARGGGRAKCK